jgi:hypothetical protein
VAGNGPFVEERGDLCHGELAQDDARSFDDVRHTAGELSI